MLPETGAFELNRRLESLVLSGCNGLSRFSVPLLPEPLDERYERKEAKDKRVFFNLKAANHQVIGSSQMYKTEAGMENGIKSVKTNGPSKLVTAV